MKIAIIGAGPAGIMAALEARKKQADVLLIDANPSVGRKLAATGSGRCNLTNTHAQPERYFTSAPEQLSKVFSRFGNKELITWLENLGIFTYASADGWVYPLSNSAQNVVDILTAQLNEAGIEKHLQTLITDIQFVGKQFHLSTQDPARSFRAERVIIAAGGPATPQLGARDNIYAILKRLGQPILPVEPALAPLLTDAKSFHKLQGVRLDAGVTLLAKGKEIGNTMGNIIFTSWGLNGPGVMDLSHLVSQHTNEELELRLDFLPDQEPLFQELLLKKKRSSIPVFILLESFLPSKVAHFILEQCHLPEDKQINQMDESEFIQLSKTLHNQKVAVKGVKGFKDCQLSTGGVPLSEIDPDSMQSLKVNGLFFAGEILDVNGPCGGYNLQWAFTSGFVAGNHVQE
jgi:predicted Rossmann fold flavoprotein